MQAIPWDVKNLRRIFGKDDYHDRQAITELLNAKKGRPKLWQKYCENFVTRPIVKGGLTIMLFNYQAQ